MSGLLFIALLLSVALHYCQSELVKEYKYTDTLLAKIQADLSKGGVMLKDEGRQNYYLKIKPNIKNQSSAFISIDAFMLILSFLQINKIINDKNVYF